MVQRNGRLYVLATVLGLSMMAAVHAADPGFPTLTGDPSVLPAGARLERLFDGACALTEGVAVGHDGMLYFSDITFSSMCKDPSGRYPQAGHIWKYHPQTGKATIFRSPSGMSNGIKFDVEGHMIAALGADYGGRMLVKTDMQTGKSYILTGQFECWLWARYNP
jgi:gluconolactonase